MTLLLCSHKTCLPVRLMKLQLNYGVRGIFSTTGIWNQELTLDMKQNIEKCWKDHINTSVDNSKINQDKLYLLSMFPYPSGRLHMGHVRVYSISDTLSRLYSLLGKQVIHPMGWDAFGLPAENASIDHGLPPNNWTKSNINHMKQQLQQLGFNFDWRREIITCEPEYYQWTQYLFLKMFDMGLVYQKEAFVNWDPIDQTVVADEQIDENNCSWRSGAQVEKKLLRQWFVKTTRYAKSLYEGLNELQDWDDIIKLQQNWIGKPDGCVFELPITLHEETIQKLAIFTQQPAAIFGISFIALSPSNPLNQSKYYEFLTDKLTSDKTGISLILKALHPITSQPIPVFITDSVDYLEFRDSHLGIPSTNVKDTLFAERHNLPIINVVDKYGYLINSGEFTGLKASTASEAIKSAAMIHNCGGYDTSSRLRDWLISRQRYWGTPIPIIHCSYCRVVPVPYEDLPVKLPVLSSVSHRGHSALIDAHEWINVKCPKCGSPAKRERDTMDTFFDSSWYYLRYLDPNNRKEPFNKAIVDKLMPVDLYIGGKEHAILHLYYARFMSHFCHDAGLISYQEPFKSFLAQGMVMGQSYKVANSGKYLHKDQVDLSGKIPVEKSTGNALIVDWEKMSKSKYNGVDPKEVIDKYGVDTTRLFIMAGATPKSHRLWTLEMFEEMETWQSRLWLLIYDFRKICCSTSQACQLTLEEMCVFDRELYETSNYFIYWITKYMLQRQQISLAINQLQSFTTRLRMSQNAMSIDSYKKLSGNKKELIREVVCSSKEYEKALCSLVIMLSCLIPHFASELWLGISTLPKKKNNYLWSEDVSKQSWPKIDKDYQPNIIIKVNDMEKCYVKISKEVLNSMTKTEALNYVLMHPHVQSQLQAFNYELYHFSKPDPYEAHLNFEVKKEIKKTKKK